MLDVHAPEHSIGGVRDFLLHLFTITCGLLIALGLENAAEAWHHRQERREAETVIREEIAQNRNTLLTAKSVLEERIGAMKLLLAYATARSKDQPAEFPVNAIVFAESPFPESAWRTASSTGVLQYLPYAEAQQYADAYQEQAMLQKKAEQALDDYFELESLAPQVGPGKFDFSPEVAQAALPIVRRALADLHGLYDIGAGTLGSYNGALK